MSQPTGILLPSTLNGQRKHLLYCFREGGGDHSALERALKISSLGIGRPKRRRKAWIVGSSNLKSK